MVVVVVVVVVFGRSGRDCWPARFIRLGEDDAWETQRLGESFVDADVRTYRAKAPTHFGFFDTSSHPSCRQTLKLRALILLYSSVS